MLKSNSGKIIDDGSWSFDFDPTTMTAEVTLPRARVDRSRWVMKLLTIALIAGFYLTANYFKVVHDIENRAYEYFGFFLGNILILFPLAAILSADHTDHILINVQRRRPASKVRFTKDAIIFSPGGAREIRLGRSDLIATDVDPKKKGEEDDFFEKPLSGILKKSGGSSIRVLDRCLQDSDIRDLMLLIASWGQGYDQFLETYVQHQVYRFGHRPGLKRNCPAWIADDLLQVYRIYTYNFAEFSRIDTIGSPVSKRAIAVWFEEVTRPEFIEAMKALPGYQLCFEWPKGGWIAAVFRPEGSVSEPLLTLADFIERVLHQNRREPVEVLIEFLNHVAEHPEFMETIVTQRFVPETDAPMVARQILSPEMPEYCKELSKSLSEALSRLR